MNRVVITGMGWITPMGHSVDAVWPRLLKGESGISRTTIFDASTFPTSISAEVKDFRLADHLESVELHSGANFNIRSFSARQARTSRERAPSPSGGGGPEVQAAARTTRTMLPISRRRWALGFRLSALEVRAPEDAGM